MLTLILYIFGISLVCFRFAGYKSQTFQAIAHLSVGGLFLASWGWYNWWWLGLALGMSFAELVAFIQTRRAKNRMI